MDNDYDYDSLYGGVGVGGVVKNKKKYRLASPGFEAVNF
jgi:hypothetical protein